MMKNTLKGSLLVFTLIGSILLSGCTALDSAVKDFESDTKGLEREVVVYTNAGDEIGRYEGNVRVSPSEYGGKVIFELDGKRYAFYGATVSVIEK